MPAGTLISVEEYLRTFYRPDCDYIDGRVEQRNLGEWDHSIATYLGTRRKQLGINVVVEQRVQALHEIKSGILKTENPAIEVPLNELFEA